jgi:hypothetical protein
MTGLTSGVEDREEARMRSTRDHPLSIAQEAVRALAGRLVAMFGLKDCRYESFPFDAQLPRIEPGRILLPSAEPGLAPWEPGYGVELPVRTDGLTLGRFVLVPSGGSTCGAALSPRCRATAISLAERLAPVIAAAILADQHANDEP